MVQDSYLQWLSKTSTKWWNDSGNADELRYALEHGATGVTTNPCLASQALRSKPELWQAISDDIAPEIRAEAYVEQIVRSAAKMFMPQYERSGGKDGYVCAQVNPVKAADSAAMLAMAKRLHSWSPNITVKLPATAAGLEALEECTAEGISTTATLSFTVPQSIATAQRHQKGLERAIKAGKPEVPCFSVIMIGRLDDYLREVALDRKASVDESDISSAGLAVVKRVYQIFQERGYKATLVVAALRGIHHMLGLAGGELIMSIHPKIQSMLQVPGVSREELIDMPVDPEIINRLSTISEFVKAYEPDGMKPEEFFTYGVTQRTLLQFIESGWMQMESFKHPANLK